MLLLLTLIRALSHLLRKERMHLSARWPPIVSRQHSRDHEANGPFVTQYGPVDTLPGPTEQSLEDVSKAVDIDAGEEGLNF